MIESALRQIGATDRVVAACILLTLALACAWVVFAALDWPFIFVIGIALVTAAAQAVLWSTVSSSGLRESEERLSTMFRRSIDQRRMAIRDDTTGLYHRWYLELRLVEESQRCERYGLSMVVVVLKAGLVQISAWSSDEWRRLGAEAGLRAASVVRSVDLNAALGPLEYAFCLVHCDREGAMRAVERMVEELSEFKCEAGVAMFPDDKCPPPTLIELARGRAKPVMGTKIEHQRQGSVIAQRDAA